MSTKAIVRRPPHGVDSILGLPGADHVDLTRLGLRQQIAVYALGMLENVDDARWGIRVIRRGTAGMERYVDAWTAVSLAALLLRLRADAYEYESGADPRHVMLILDDAEFSFFRVDPVAACPVCDAVTLLSEGDYNICSVCWWEDDPVARIDEDYVGGPNGQLSLKEARKLFARQGVADGPARDRYLALTSSRGV